MQLCIKFYFICLYETQNVSGDTPPIIRNLNLHQQPLVLHKWRVVGRVVAGRCQVEHLLILYLTAFSNYTSNNPPLMQNQKLLVQFQAPDDGRCVARNMLSFLYIYIYIYTRNKIRYTVASGWISYVNYTMMHGSTNIKMSCTLFISYQIYNCSLTR